MNENETAKKKREWVKNAAIIFLAILLVLTFFSNTIMNYSLPEVSTEYVQSGTITEKVRGTGNLEASDPYNVMILETRKIQSVAVKAGDKVEKDAVLYYLEDSESTELAKAESELEELRLAYLTGLFSGDVSGDVITNVASGNTGSFNTYKAQITAIEDKILAAKNRLNSATVNQQNATNVLNNLEGQKNLNSANVVDTTPEENALTSATNNVNNAVAEQKRIESEIVAVDSRIKEAISLLGEPVADANGKLTLEGGIIKYQEAKTAADNLVYEIEKVPDGKLDLKKKEIDKYEQEGKQAEKEKAEKEYEEINIYMLPAAREQVSLAESELNKAMAALNSYNSDTILLSSLQASLENANNNVNSAQETQRNAQASLDNKKASQNNKGTEIELGKQIAQATTSSTKTKTDIENITAEITKLEEEKKLLVGNITNELTLDSKNTLISKKEEEVEKLREKSIGSSIKAPMAGTVSTVGHVAGETTDPAKAVAVIQPEGKGFTVAFTATTEQAKKLSIGEIAEIQNAWYYDEVKATLVSIKPDTTDPAQKKMLTFSVEGDVQAGQSLSLSVGQKSANYELVVPNSAIREDKNGKFILKVDSKSSPLGNRYIATRVDVEVVAADDTHTAISAGLYGSEYVITTATKPVEAGKQVRLAN